MANHASNYLDIGTLGEDLTAQWLISQAWNVLHRQWHSRWGEIDIIAEYTHHFEEETNGAKLPILAFVEVKTRRRQGWDAGGKRAIAYDKQVKIYRTAQAFLSKYPEKAEYECHFDVAIVSCRLVEDDCQSRDANNLASKITHNYYLSLQEYIIAAFDTPME